MRQHALELERQTRQFFRHRLRAAPACRVCSNEAAAARARAWLHLFINPAVYRRSSPAKPSRSPGRRTFERATELRTATLQRIAQALRRPPGECIQRSRHHRERFPISQDSGCSELRTRASHPSQSFELDRRSAPGWDQHIRLHVPAQPRPDLEILQGDRLASPLSCSDQRRSPVY